MPVPARALALLMLALPAARRDPAGTATRYREALSLGATVPVADVYRAAGTEMAFDRETLAPLVQEVEAALDEGTPYPIRIGARH